MKEDLSALEVKTTEVATQEVVEENISEEIKATRKTKKKTATE